MAVSTVSYTNTPQATDDTYDYSEDWYLSHLNDNGAILIDVMANDLGGKAKTLYSIDNGDALKDLLSKDPNLSTQWDKTADGNDIRINAGKIEFRLSDNAKVDSLPEGAEYHDSFTYAIQLGNGTISCATVNLNFVGQNDAASIDGSSSDNVTEAGGLANSKPGDPDASGTLNVTDVDTGQARFQVPTESSLKGTYGDFTFDADTGQWTYKLNQGSADKLCEGEQFTETLTVTSFDGSASTTIEVTVTGTNDAPALTGSQAVLAGGTEDTGYTLNAADLLAGFSDVEGDSLSVTDLVAEHGSLSDNGDGTWEFTPDANFNGTVSVSYKVYDGTDKTAASQSFDLAAVNDAPELTGSQAGLAGGTEDTGYTLKAADLLAGFSDVEGDSLSVTDLVAEHGSLSDNGDGTWEFTPDANFNGTVNVSYKVYDGTDKTAATQSFDLAAVNDAAVITGSSMASLTETNAAQSTGGDLDATDVDSSADFVAQTDVAGSNGYGKFSIDAAGAWTYVMNSAHDEFVDGQDYSDSITVATADGTTQVLTVTIHGTADGPVPAPQVFTGTGDANDWDSIDSANAAAGAVTFNGSGNAQDTIHGSNLADSISGNNGADSIFGNGGNDTLSGGDQADKIYGGSGDDNISGGNQADELYGGSGADTVTGNEQNDKIFGGSGNDTIDGGTGNGQDQLVGGYGADRLTGGGGADTFIFLQANDTGDTITDFSKGEDKIDFSALYTGTLGFTADKTTLSEHGAISFYDSSTNQTIVQVDSDGNASTAELQIQLTGNIQLAATDFLL